MEDAAAGEGFIIAKAGRPVAKVVALDAPVASIKTAAGRREADAMAAPNLCTERLILRPWGEADLAPFAALNADPEVMRHFPAPLSRVESDAMAVRLAAFLQHNAFGQWAVEVAGGAPFIGYVGLTHPRFDAAFTPCVEVGWRLAAEHWGRGYATEAARAALVHAFEAVGLAEVLSFTVPANLRSIAVMERIGMTRSAADDFDHPLIRPGHRLRRHVLYRLSAAARSEGAERGASRVDVGTAPHPVRNPP